MDSTQDRRDLFHPCSTREREQVWCILCYHTEPFLPPRRGVVPGSLLYPYTSPVSLEETPFKPKSLVGLPAPCSLHRLPLPFLSRVQTFQPFSFPPPSGPAGVIVRVVPEKRQGTRCFFVHLGRCLWTRLVHREHGRSLHPVPPHPDVQSLL